jgi:hypothetical protein
MTQLLANLALLLSTQHLRKGRMSQAIWKSIKFYFILYAAAALGLYLA